MKIIHCADLHLSSPVKGFPKELAQKIKTEVKNAFLNVVEYAREQDVHVILLAGDVFDEEKVRKTDADFFYKIVEMNEDIDFLYLRGNHDQAGEERMFDNLKTFSSEWQSYTYGNVVISGIELSEENSGSMHSTLSTDAKMKNVVMLHGQVGEDINLVSLRNKNIDYLALGHVHKFMDGALDGRGRYAYSGCLQGRGYDETGKKGFVLLDIGDTLSYQFVPISRKDIENLSLDVSGLTDGYSIYQHAQKEIAFDRGNIYRIELVGDVPAEVEMERLVAEVERYLSAYCAHVRVKDRTSKTINYAAYEGDNSLRGEFVRMVRDSEEYTEEEKAHIIVCGLKALDGQEVDA